MGILFDSSPTEPTNLREVVFQALGAASICWDTPQDAGVFHSDRAKEIGDEVVAWIEANYRLSPVVPVPHDGALHVWDGGTDCETCGKRHA